MTYGELEIMVEYRSVVFTRRKRQEVRHYLNTDYSRQIVKGRDATIISCVILARDDAELKDIERNLHNDREEELHFHNFFYKRVITDDEFTAEPADYIKAKWRITAGFIALDPIPYDSETREALY